MFIVQKVIHPSNKNKRMIMVYSATTGVLHATKTYEGVFAIDAIESVVGKLDCVILERIIVISSKDFNYYSKKKNSIDKV